MEVQELVVGKEVLHPDTTSFVLSTVFNTIVNRIEHNYLDEVVRCPNACPITHRIGDCAPLKKYSIPSLARTISKTYFRPGGMARSEWTRSIGAIRDTRVADYSVPGLNTMHRVAYRRPIAGSPFLMLCRSPIFNEHSGVEGPL
jgi:hypothetical protein